MNILCRSMLFIACTSLVLAGCSWDNQEAFYPPDNNCDTLAVSYHQDIKPIVSNNCLACHSADNAPVFGAGLALDSHEQVAGHIEMVLAVIKHEQGFPPMPRNAAKLDSCSLAMFAAWYNQGVPDN